MVIHFFQKQPRGLLVKLFIFGGQHDRVVVCVHRWYCRCCRMQRNPMMAMAATTRGRHDARTVKPRLRLVGSVGYHCRHTLGGMPASIVCVSP